MALKHLGTNANNSISNAVAFLPGIGSIPAADMATMMIAIKDDLGNLHSIVPNSFTTSGLLFVPNRGVLQVRAGDVVGVDSRGWPILLSADTIANGPWTFA